MTHSALNKELLKPPRNDCLNPQKGLKDVGAEDRKCAALWTGCSCFIVQHTEALARCIR